MTAKQVRAQYTQKFKLKAVRQVRAGQAIAEVAKVLGIPKASLGNWVRLAAMGPLSGAGEADKAARVSPEQPPPCQTPCRLPNLWISHTEATPHEKKPGVDAVGQCNAGHRGTRLGSLSEDLLFELGGVPPTGLLLVSDQ